MKKSVMYVLLAVFIGVFAFSAYKLGSYWLEKVRSDQALDGASEFVDIVPGDENSDGKNNGDEQTAPEKITVDFDALKAMNEDVVAWIYCPGTKINYPVLQAEDNDYYLYRLMDGAENINGSIFMDYRNDSALSDGNTLIYGHHMRSGAMFAALIDYKSQSYYDKHPYIYILTPTQNYRLDLFAACLVDSTSDIYTKEPTEAILRDCIARSYFDTDIDYPTGNVVTLSTCTYEYDDARFIVLGELVPMVEE